ncbi:DUF924 family protein [Ferrovibrio sp.]|jgi:uncharacterized protein (DUF924 family)|uniref:DUF924 family protein n=1 Tax=Ferrovibrio sp. TaxID=1917215 RepID=UPI0035AD9D87
MSRATATPSDITPAIILDFWFDRGGPEALRPRKVWWEKSPAFDEEIRRRFDAAVETALAGGYEEWAGQAESALALVLLLDQFPRNLFRNSARAFAGDERARTVARQMTDRGFDIGLPPAMRQFAYMPFEHSEAPEDQDFSCLLFAALEKDLPGHDLLDYAERHRAIIARFNRFPHRNAALGRESTPEEVEFLRQPGSSF